MTTDSPVAILFNTDGYEVNVKPNVSIPTGTSAILAAGSDGNNSRFILVDTLGHQILVGAGTAGSQTGGLITIQGDPSGTPIPVSGSITTSNATISTTGSTAPALASYIGANVTTAAPTYVNSTMNALSLTTSGLLRIDGSGVTQPISGTITANIGTSGSLALDSSVNGILLSQGSTTSGQKGSLVQGAVTTASPSYTATQTSPLSLTTAGALRTDSSAVTQPVSGTVAATQSGTWTVQPGNTANTTPWLTTINQGGNSATVSAGGALKVDSSAVTQPVSGTITANAGTGTFAVSGTVTANIGTSGSLALEATQAKLTIAQSVALGANTQVMVGGSVTTAAPTYTTGNINPFSLTTAGALRIDGSGSTQPVSGTVTANAGSGTFTVSGTIAATQSGTWTVQPGNTANTTPWLASISQGGNSATVSAGGALKVDGSAVTQPVSGTVTANIGTSGSLALETTQAKLTIAQSTALGSNTQALVGGSVTTAAPTYTTGNINPFSLTTAGALRVDGSSSTQPVSGTITANAGSGTFAISAATLPLPTGASTETTLATLLTSATFTGRINTQGQKTMSASTPVVIASDQSAITVTGTVTAANASVSTTGTSPPASATYAGASVTTAAPTYTTGQMSALSLTTAGGLRVDGSGTTQPISGTVTANAGTGTFTVSGTVTANIGTSGSLALESTQAKLTIAQSAALGANTQVMVGGSVTTAAPTYTTGNINPFSLTTAGALRVDGSGTTQPVSGTVAATQSGTWTVQPGNTANTTPWLTTISQGGNSATVSAGGALKIDGSAVTQPVSGTVTANIGTSGSLALDTSVNGILLSQGSTTSGQKGSLVQGAVTTGSPTYTTAQTSPLSLTTAGALRTDSSAVTQPVSIASAVTVAQATASSLNATIVGTTAAGSGASSGLLTVQGNASGTPIPVSGTVTATNASVSTTGSAPPASATYMGASVTTAAPAYTTGQMSALSLTTAGLLRVDGVYPINAATPTTDITFVGGAVTTAAPTYTTGQLSAFSLTTTGSLRIDGSGSTQPVSGTITANIGTSGSLALDATLAKLTIAQSAALGSNTQALVGGSVTTAAPTYTTGNINPLSLTTAGALRVDGSGTTQPVSGTVTANAGSGTFTVSGTVAATQSGTWTVQPGNTANTTPWLSTINQGGNSATVTASNALKVDGSAVTQPISGTVTANAGTGTFTVSGTVTANVGTTNGLALDATLAKLTVAQSTALGSNTQAMVGGSVTTAAPTYTTGNINPLSLTTAGALRTDGSGATQPVSGTVTANAGSGTFTVSGTVTANVGTTNGLALDTSVNGILLSQGSTTSGQKGNLTQGAVTTAAPTYTTAQTSPLSLTTAGALRIDGSGATQPVSGTVTANIGTSGSLALDATLSAQSLVDNAAFTDTVSKVVPSGYILDEVAGTALTENDVAASRIDSKRAQVMVIEDTTTRGQRLTITASNAMKVDGSASTQPVSGTVTANAGTGNFTVVQATAANLNAQVQGTAADGAAVSGNPVLMGGQDGTNAQSILTDTTGRQVIVGSVTDKTSMVAGTQVGVPTIGQSSGVGRISRLNRLGHTIPGFQTLLALDPIEGSTVNSWLWTQSTTTMTIVQTTGLLVLNSSATTTTTTDAIITSNRQFPIAYQAPIGCSFKALATQTTNSVIELGFGAPAGTTAIINNGAFFRIQSSGQIKCVTSFNGTETVSGVIATLITTSYYLFVVVMEESGARFIVEDSAGVPIVDVFEPIPIATPDKAQVSHIPSFARVYNSGTAGAAAQLKISSYQAWQYDIDTSKPWAHQLSSTGRDSAISPTAFSQTTQMVNAAAPTAFTPSNTVAGNAFLGGEANVNLSATSESLLSVFAFQVPSPYTLILDSAMVAPPVITTAAAATATILEWVLIYNASSGNLSTATGQIRRSLGFHTAAASATAGTLFTGNPLSWFPQTPVACIPGTFVHLAVKVILGAATGAYRASCNIGGYYE